MINHQVKCMAMGQRKKDIPQYRMFKVSYLGPTNTQGGRVKIKDERFESSRIIPFGYQFNTMREQAIDYLEKIGIKISGYASDDRTDYLLTKDFQTDLK